METKLSIGDRVMFNPKRKNMPLAVDGEITEISRKGNSTYLHIKPKPDVAWGVREWRIQVNSPIYMTLKKLK